MRVSVFRYDPDNDARPRYDKYELQYKKDITVMGVLESIYNNLDGTLAFEYECRNGYCGRCALLINKRPVLACKTLANKEMLVEPLPNILVIRDLVVDRSLLDEKMNKIRPFMERGITPTLEPEDLKPQDFKLYKMTSRCLKCASCYSVCPVVADSPSEFIGPSVMVEIAKHSFDPRDVGARSVTSLQEGVFNCVGCLKCNDVCPSEIPILDLIEGMRGQVLERKMGPSEQVEEIKKEMFLSGFPFRRFSSAPTFLERTPETIEATNSNERVAFFVGCTYNAHSPKYQRIADSVVKILSAKGVSICIPKEQKCCGLPLIQTGLTSLVEEKARKNVESLVGTGVGTVVTACPGCGLMLKNEYPKILARKMPFKVQDISEYLDGLPSDGLSKHKVDLRVTYHDPCHLKRGMGISQEPRRLLLGIPGLDLTEMNEADRCCGAGGEVRVLNLKLARTLARKKADEIVRRNVHAVVASCPFCKSQIEDILRLTGNHKIKVLHTIELMAMTYGIDRSIQTVEG
jgi:fumarate reductase (CoM/CoB) subunit B